MDTIVLYNQNGQKFDVDVIRYFKNDGHRYLIFSMDEIDGNGYLQLYVSRIEDFGGKYNMLNIIDDAEWDSFKKAIHGIVNNNRAGIPNTSDLDFNSLDGTVINQFRIFKLKKDVAETLSQNKNPQGFGSQATIPAMPTPAPAPFVAPAVEKVENAVNLETASAQDTGMTLEQIIKRVSDTAKEAREEQVETPKKTIDDLLRDAKPVTPAYEEELQPKYIPSQVKPVMEDYKAKYEDALADVHRLEEENMRLINELVEAKAKIETIKDIIA